MASQATEMRATAESMFGHRRPDEPPQATTVAASLEQASTNVSDRRRATEEMGASIAEISRQVRTPTNIPAGRSTRPTEHQCDDPQPCRRRRRSARSSS